MVKLSDKAKTSKEEKEQFRKSINLRAKNQIIRVYMSNILDPDTYTTILSKAANAQHLHRIDQDVAHVHTNDLILGSEVDGFTKLLLLVLALSDNLTIWPWVEATESWLQVLVLL